MGITKLALRYAAPLPKIENYDRYLFVGPHPDDIEIGAGATAAKLAAAGKEVCFLICTDGRYGDGYTKDTMTREELISLRRQECLASAKILGVTDVRFLYYSDGGFYKAKNLRASIAQVIGDFKPDVIFAPDPDVTSECHIDHLRVGDAVKKIGYLSQYEGIMAEFNTTPAPIKAIAFYMTAKPNRYIKTGKKLLQRQLSSVFECHLSQYPKDCKEAQTVALYIKLRSIDFGIKSFKGRAEGFRVLGPIHMHCLPESELL